jgi:hypothetical protein
MRAVLRCAVRMAVKAGVPIEDLTSLSALVHPDVALKVLDAYWRRDGEIPKTYTINLSCRFVALAHAIGGFEEDAVRRLEDARFALEQHREEGMTPKNYALIRRVLTDGVWSRIVNLPDELLRQARLQRRHAPVRAAALAQIATAVAILTVAPVRLDNLANIRLGENLIKPDGPGSNFWLTFRKYDVKNKVPLQFRLDQTVTAIIDQRARFPPRFDAEEQRSGCSRARPAATKRRSRSARKLSSGCKNRRACASPCISSGTLRAPSF